MNVPDELWEIFESVEAHAAIDPDVVTFSDAARNALGAVLDRVRQQIAEEIDAQKTGCREHPMPLPKPSCWVCARDGAFNRSAAIARGDSDVK